MNKQELLDGLESFRNNLVNLRNDLLQLDKKRVWASQAIATSKEIAIEWFDAMEPILVHFGISSDVVSMYSDNFESLLKLVARSGPSKTSMQKAVDDVLSGFSDDLIVGVQKFSQPLGSSSAISYIDSILKNTQDDERNYLLEALDCVRVGAKRATVIMGWCAAIDRLHRKVESLGFDQFNQKSQEMKKKTTGRYKRFNKSFEISSIHELRASVFDTDLLWVLEYWGLIDSNQHNRLSACYVMRTNSAHPGKARISDENLVSFFSDLRVIIFDNLIFQL